jgi:hypothetical protein
MTGGIDNPREEALAEQGRAMVAAAVAQTFAPQSLRERLEADRARAARGRRRRGVLTAVLGAAALALAALLIGLAAAPSGDEAPTVGAVVRLGDRPPAAPAPAAGARPGTLRASVGGVTFPDWRRLSWPATGTRTDDLAGRSTRTVFYRTVGGGRAAYTIVDGAPLDAPRGGTVRRVDDVDYRVVRDADETVVVWEEGGHTCVLSAPAAVPGDALVQFAAWEPV